MKPQLNECAGPRNGRWSEVTPLERRTFLKIGLAITGLVGGGKLLSVASIVNNAFATPRKFIETYPYKPHYAMVISEALCIDCELCTKACRETNHVPDYGYRTRVLTKITSDAVGRQREFIPILCNQCNDPPCCRACPVRATYKDPRNGIVQMDVEKCIGCKTCMLACPYDARYFDDEKHAVDKCNFCWDTRLSKGKKLTACAAVCPTGARTFGDISNPDDIVFKMVHQIETAVWVLRPACGTKPNVFYMKGSLSSPWRQQRQEEPG